ncbi:MAG: poly-beta-1,6-N-acetyl-D-glucosamine synthase [Nevskia sp.]|nr:poly-beta-1,6-N-acetyl-D-glucosamine synthase [Nevskia sp.]
MSLELLSSSSRIVGDFLLGFMVFYPLYMAYHWMLGALYYYFLRERGKGSPDRAPVLPAAAPMVTILVPCFNEADNVRETIGALTEQGYPDLEIIAINDGSRDDTGRILDELLQEIPNLRVIHFARNQGKAMGLRMGALAARGEYLVCIDGDAVLHPNAVAHLVRHFIEYPRCGAVTGNPRIRTRSTLVGRVQVGEFSSVVGLIKRTQRVCGNLFTVSGVVCAYRRAALHQCGYWGLDMVTEDIDATWRLQLHHWSIHYEPNAICWMLMPETLRGLWRQRVRWAQGGAEVFRRYGLPAMRWRHRRLWTLLAEYIASLLWSFTVALFIVVWGLRHLAGVSIHPPAFDAGPAIYWRIVFIATYLAQCLTALSIERRYDHHFGRTLFWVVWYPSVFWIVTFSTSLVGLFKALRKKRHTRARWVSPDRGFRAHHAETHGVPMSAEAAASGGGHE